MNKKEHAPNYLGAIVKLPITMYYSFPLYVVK